MGIQKIFSILNHFIIIKFHIAGTETILIRKVDYFKYCLDIEAGNVYKTNIYISACLNGAGIVEILNIY